MTEAERTEWADRNLVLVLVARVAMSAARGVAGVVTALYLAAEGFSAFRIGLLFLAVALAAAALSTSIGLYSDVLGRKPFLVVVPLLASVAGLVYAYDRSQVFLFVFGALGSFGRGAGAGAGNVGPYQPAEAAFVAEIAPHGRRTAAFGRLSFASSLGALAGGLLAGLARPGSLTGAAATSAYRPAFLAAAALAAVAGVTALWLREPRRTRSHANANAHHRISFPRRSWGVLWRLWITNGLNGMAIGLFGPFVSYWFHRRYGASPAEIGILFAVINAATLGSALSAAAVGRRFGTLRAIVAVRMAQGLLLVPMALAPSFLVASGIYLLRMTIQRVGLPLRQSFVQDVADPDERASLAALSNLPAQGTQAGSQVLAGYVFDEVSLAAPLMMAGALQALNAVVYAALFRPREPSVQAPAPDLVDALPLDSTEPAPASARDGREAEP